MKVYKVVHNYFDAYLSYIVDAPKYCCRYQIGETTKEPVKGAPLMAFRTLEQAKEFRLMQELGTILECKARTIKGKNLRVALYAELTSINIFWSHPNPYIPTRPAPHGTVFCKTITPIRAVD